MYESKDGPPHYKVLFIFDSKFSEWKGTQRFFYEFGSYLKENGYHVTLIENDRQFTEEPVPKNVDLPFDIVSLQLRRILSIYRVPKNIIKKIDPDVIYASSFSSFPLIPSSDYGTIYGMHIIHVSSLKYMPMKERFRFDMKKIFFKLILKFVWRKKDIMIHALNTDQRDWIVKVTNNRFPVRVIGNPVDCRIDETIAYLSKIEKNERFTVLYFGSLSAEKGFARFLSILDHAERSLTRKISFIIAGDGGMRNQAISASLKYENVEFIKRPDDEQKKKIMFSSDLFVFPSINETFSFTAVEALSSGLPCLFSDITPLKNIAIEGKTGYCLSLDDGFEKSFSDKIAEYLKLWQNDYEGYRKMRIEIAEITRRLCKENVLPQLLDMVESLINKDKELLELEDPL